MGEEGLVPAILRGKGKAHSTEPRGSSDISASEVDASERGGLAAAAMGGADGKVVSDRSRKGCPPWHDEDRG